MSEKTEPKLRMRSWLFAPGDSNKKMAKAAEGEADIVIFDLEDAVVESGKADARAAIAEFLGSKLGRLNCFLLGQPIAARRAEG